MKKVMQRICPHGENGQTTIFVAIVMLFVLIPMVGVVVEGGRVFVTYRKMQAAADMAALVASQKLPAATTARQDGCNYAMKNGFGLGYSGGGCLPDANGDSVTVCVPPQSKSPYNWMPFTTGGATPCDPTATSSHFAEVQITKNLGTVPIFNIPVILYSHAVSRNGIPGVADYAIIALDPTSTSTNGIEMDGLSNGVVSYGSVSSNNSDVHNSINSPGSGVLNICAGSAITSGGESVQSNVATYNNGSNPPVNFAPASCVGTADSSVDWLAHGGEIGDPYASTPNPTPCTDTVACSTGGGNMYTNCNACGALGWYTSPTGTGWTQASATQAVNVNGTKEFFPGIYNGFSIGNNDVALFNPGVYTITGDFKVTGGTICVFGAPVCDHVTSSLPSPATTNCANTDFTNANTPSGTWFYYCSPYGFWDSSAHGGSRPSILSTAPTFLNTTTLDTTGMKQLNGVTFYLSGASVKFSGSPSASLAAPNPCPGTGRQSGLSVPFPAGSSTVGGYTYPGTSYPAQTPGGAVAPTNTYIYPSDDFTRNGECLNPGAVWNNEFGGNPPSQHMQFLFWQQEDDNQDIELTGTGNYNWFGIVHSFKPYSTAQFPPPPTTACTGATGCNVKISGNSGAGANGPPMLFGQVVGNTDKFNGSSILMVFNRPGGVASGPGTSLIE
jgi:Putative Flp pilus-assembly TadE/G-like